MADETKKPDNQKDPKIEDLRTKDATNEEQDKVKGGSLEKPRPLL